MLCVINENSFPSQSYTNSFTFLLLSDSTMISSSISIQIIYTIMEGKISSFLYINRLSGVRYLRCLFPARSVYNSVCLSILGRWYHCSHCSHLSHLPPCSPPPADRPAAASAPPGCHPRRGGGGCCCWCWWRGVRGNVYLRRGIKGLSKRTNVISLITWLV